MANIARVTPRTLWSGKVANANAANATYAASANTNLFATNSTCRSRANLVHREGFEPSYLRGGADLQSAGFNHSPTCALAVSVEQRALSNALSLAAHRSQLKAFSDTPQPSLRFTPCHWDQKVRVRNYSR
jgi:hypothetical protein